MDWTCYTVPTTEAAGEESCERPSRILEASELKIDDRLTNPAGN